MNNTAKAASHTPGPWSVCTRLTGHRYNGAPVSYFSVSHTSETRDCFIATELAPVTLVTSAGEVPNSEGEANARLIAAAPELLDLARDFLALVECHEFRKHTDSTRHGALDFYARSARNALAKATRP